MLLLIEDIMDLSCFNDQKTFRKLSSTQVSILFTFSQKKACVYRLINLYMFKNLCLLMNIIDVYIHIYNYTYIHMYIYECKYVSIHVCMKRFIQKKTYRVSYGKY